MRSRYLALTLTAIAIICWLFPLPALAGGKPEALRICTTGDYRPLTYLDPVTGRYSGVDIDMATDLASFLGRAPLFAATTWPTLSDDLATPGRCDIAVGGITATAARQQVATFTQSYLSSGKVAVVAAGNADRFGSLDQIDQPGVRVIENPGGTNEVFARERLPHADLIIWPDNTTIFDQLAEGKADVMITDAVEALYQSTQHPGLVAVHPDRPFTSEHKVYLLPKDSSITPQVDTWLGQALRDGTFDRIYQRWIG